jgi:hypothetical protein
MTRGAQFHEEKDHDEIAPITARMLEASCNGLQLRQTPACLCDARCTSAVILSEAKDLKIRNLRSFAVFAAQDDGARMPLN